MKALLLLALGLLVQSSECFAQVSGNMAYAQPNGKLRPEQNERDKRLPPQNETPLGSNAMFLEASVLINVLADEYVAVFAVSQEGATPMECNQKMDAVLKQFIDALKPLGIGSNDFFVDEMYEAYTAAESERFDRAMFQSKYAIQDLRKSRTFYFNPLNANGFDTVLNPVVVEPVVQFTLHLKLRYDIDLKKSKGHGRLAP